MITNMMNKSNQNVANMLMRNPMKGFEPKRIIKRYEVLSKKDEEAVLKFYDMLAPEAKSITVDIEMIVTKAFPVFEEMLGANGWNKIVRYFGFGLKAPVKNIKREEVVVLISRLRTIENAQFYLYGFSELLEKFAIKLSRTPENMSEITKAKVVRMFVTLFNGYFFFAEDYMMPFGAKEPRINYVKAAEVNKKMLYPEELYYLYDASIKKYSDGSFLFDAIIAEIKSFDKRLKKDILEFAELRFDENGQLSSVNNKPSNSTFGYVRGIKTRMFSKVGYFPLELYFVKDMWKGIEFGEIYNIYKKLTLNEFSTFESKLRKMPCVEGGGRFVEKDCEFKMIAPSVEMSGPEEANRFIRFVEYLANTNVTMPIELITEGEKDVLLEDVEIGKFFAFLQFANECEYITKDTPGNEEYNMYLTLLDYDTSGEVFTEYMNGEISTDEVKQRLSIDKKFEEEVLGIVHIETPLEAAKRFAVEIGAVENCADISEELVESVLISKNEDIWERFSQGKISSNKLMEKLGFDNEIKEMFFQLSKIDVQTIEQKLQDLKARRVSTKEMKKNALTITLYCYIIEGQIECGPKMKTPKGNKRLKPDNLKKLIDAA